MTTAMSGSELAEELMRTKPSVTIDGLTLYVIEGDLALDEDQLLIYALQRVKLAKDEAANPGADRQGLVGIVDDNNRIVRWPKGKVLTYSVVKSTFPSVAHYQTVVDAMRAATADWEATCGVNFRHLSVWDEGNPAAAEKPLFTVRFFDVKGKFIAAAFFPNDPPDRRIVWIDPSFLLPTLSFDRIGVLRHELGHVLGFRHEHIRSGAPPVCPDETTHHTIDLTQYDPKSVMHYFCGNVGSKQLAITEIDRAGARLVYGLPDREVTYFD